ncbi:MAG: TrkH family potassium uptake protein [Acutalibacteraceae bacterium]
MTKIKKIPLSTTQIILLSFLLTIFIGSLLLKLPISSATGKAVPYLDALFTATSATCVTGLVTLPTATTWSFFGQTVILLLIQIGGLGVITIMSGFMLLLNKRVNINGRLLIQDAFNLNTLGGLVKFVKKVIAGTFIVEGIGALLYMLVFIPDFGPKGIWIAIFNSVSAFCNAGLDVIGEYSLYDYVANPLVNGVTTALIIVGGLGYIVWWDVIRVVKNYSRKNKKMFRYLSLHSKIALTTTLGLIIGGAVLLFIFEYTNPLTMGNLSLPNKIQASFFQSITTRTAGFATLPQENFTNASAFVSLVLMLIGGSPVGTAGGMKTVTIAILLYSAFATIRNKNSVTVFSRRISEPAIKRAVAVMITFMSICSVSTMLLLASSDAPALDVIFETVSATATVGLTRNFTSSLNTFGKLVITVTMYLGRIGPISLAMALSSKKENQNIISEPMEEISVG